MAELLRIDSVSITGTVLTVTWRDGTSDIVDLAGWLARPGPPEFAILNDPAVLAHPRIANYGTVVAWDDEGDIGIDNLHLKMLAAEQAPFGPDELKAWQERTRLSNQEAADLLGVQPSTWHNYKSGTTRIPRAVQIACRTVERDPLAFEAHHRPRRSGRPPRSNAA